MKIRSRQEVSAKATCLKANWNRMIQRVVFRAAHVLCFSALISELMNQGEVEAWTYHYSTKAYPWNISRAFCQKYYTDLVAIQNKNEIAHLNDVIPYYNSYYWIGIRKIDNVWTWVGTKKTLTEDAENWADNEPNNKRNNQDCVEIYIKSSSAPGKWNDEPCWRRKRALCYTASCQDMSCSKQGECIETIGNYTCTCYPGFYGSGCEYVTECGELDLPQYVLMNCSHPLGNFAFNSQCSFHCTEGYTLKGPSTLECLASGNWTNRLPQCVATQCPPMKTPEQGSMTCLHSAKDVQQQSSCSFRCDEGFMLVGSEEVQCTASGVWTAPAPVCTAIACDPMESPVHGSMDCSASPREVHYNTSCSFHCSEGFLLRGAKMVRCSELGQWTAPAPVCQALKCQYLLTPNKAKVNCSHPFGAFRYQSACSFTCDEGLFLVGVSVLQCLATGSWSAKPPECQALTCTPLQSPQNGNMTCDQSLGDSSYKSTCQFSCDEGFSLSGPERLECTTSGHWTGSSPTCEATRCPELFPLEWGSIDCSDTPGKFRVGSTCHFSCSKGFKLKGSKSVECTTSGKWTAPPPTCKSIALPTTSAIRCPALITPGQGTMSCSHHVGTLGLNTTCYFGCNAGFKLTGDRILRCSPSGQWTAVAPTCTAVKCSDLHIIKPLEMNCSNYWGNFSYGSTCAFNCPEGQVLNGSARTACQENGHWSTTMPSCQAGPLTIQEALTYFGGAVASTTGLLIGGTLLALLRRRFRQKDDGKSPLSPHSHLGTYGVFTNAAYDPSP
ncbi:PREDICTED: P-selectin [Chrysochloris asiatica]|uniref:p-selectin n=1 Tax=Chrysochloris asiatica TaxID=185453 RepID=A0A9B0WZ86_CHRAS|nr:PREDICTED: P-selectin [Chrysochloris asiatica]